MGILQRILMCKPTHFKVAYEINPWMRTTIQADNKLAHKQWENLRRTLAEDCGAKIELVDQHDGSPDMVFTANAGLVSKNRVYLSRFKFIERQAERRYFENWFRNNGFTVLPDDQDSFEGAGDALFAGEKLFAAYGFRTDSSVYNRVVRSLKPDNVPLIICQLVDPRFYHIDTCFCPITPKLAIWFPKAFSDESRRRMENEIELLPVAEAEALKFACNSVVVDQKVVLPAGSDQISQALEKRGFQTFKVDVGEFMKAGGACKCLTLNLSV